MAAQRREAERAVALCGDGLQEERDRLMRAAKAAIDAGVEEPRHRRDGHAVSPGSTRTPILAESAELYGMPSAEAFAEQQLVERLLESGEVAAMIAWLAGPGGSAVTGADVPVDGGLAV